MAIMSIILDMEDSRMTMATDTWSVAEAKNRFSELIDQARRVGPQTITRHGKSAVVVVDAETWRQTTVQTPREGFVDFLLASPLNGAQLETHRFAGELRDVEL